MEPYQDEPLISVVGAAAEVSWSSESSDTSLRNRAIRARLQTPVKGIFKQVAWAAGGTAVGGIVAGPLGAMVGGMAGSMLGYRYSSDYDSLVAVIRNLTDEEKKKIVEKVQELVGSTSLEALTHFIGAQVKLTPFLSSFMDSH